MPEATVTHSVLSALVAEANVLEGPFHIITDVNCLTSISDSADHLRLGFDFHLTSGLPTMFLMRPLFPHNGELTGKLAQQERLSTSWEVKENGWHFTQIVSLPKHVSSAHLLWAANTQEHKRQTRIIKVHTFSSLFPSQVF